MLTSMQVKEEYRDRYAQEIQCTNSDKMQDRWQGCNTSETDYHTWHEAPIKHKDDSVQLKKYQDQINTH
jgi:hypothetical protein